MSIIGAFVEHTRKIFGAVQHSIIGYFLSIIGSALVLNVSFCARCMWRPFYIPCPSLKMELHDKITEHQGLHCVFDFS